MYTTHQIPNRLTWVSLCKIDPAATQALISDARSFARHNGVRFDFPFHVHLRRSMIPGRAFDAIADQHDLDRYEVRRVAIQSLADVYDVEQRRLERSGKAA